MYDALVGATVWRAGARLGAAGDDAIREAICTGGGGGAGAAGEAAGESNKPNMSLTVACLDFGWFWAEDASLIPPKMLSNAL